MMDNFVYLIGDVNKREAIVVDPAWDVDGICEIAEADGMKIVGALCSHYHPDHVGGAMMGHTVQGIARLLERTGGVPIHVHAADIPYVVGVTGVATSDLTPRRHGDRIEVGDVHVEWLHTPGHTPGSSCFRCKNALLSGDTVFMSGCGRTDLPGGDTEEMYRTLHERLAALPGDLVLYPGHNYGGASAPLSEVRRTNPFLATDGPSAFRAKRDAPR